MHGAFGYAIPLDVLGFFKEGAVPIDSEEESIACHLHLLLTTTKDEFPPDPGYGCEVWDNEFSTVQATAVWLDRLAQDIKDLVIRYEGRLNNVEVKVEMDQAEFKAKRGEQVAGRLKRRLRVVLTARLIRTDEPFRFEDAMLIAPFSLD